MTNISSDIKVDNRNVNKAKNVVDEILNDDTPLDDNGNPKENKNTQGSDETPEDEQEIIETEDDEIAPPENKEEEPVDDPDKEFLLDDEEIDQETGEIKKKLPQKQETKQPAPQSDAERLAAQRRENIVINARNQQLTDALSKAREVKEPNESELQKEAQTQGFDWEEMTTFERSMFKDNYINKQKLRAVDEAVDGVKNIDHWSKQVDTFLDENERDQKNKSLIGKEGAFREYAMKQSHRGLPFDVLVGAFLHTTKDKMPSRTRDSLFLTKGGGQKVEPKKNLQDADYSTSLRKTNNRAWMTAAKKGKLNIEI